MILTNIFCANVFKNKSALFICTSVFMVDFQTHSNLTKNKDSLIASTVPWRTFNIHRTFSKWKNVLKKTVHLKVLFGTKNGSSMALLLFICKSEVIKHPCGCGRMTKHHFCLFTKTLHRWAISTLSRGRFAMTKLGQNSHPRAIGLFLLSVYNPNWVFQPCQTKPKTPLCLPTGAFMHFYMCNDTAYC